MLISENVELANNQMYDSLKPITDFFGYCRFDLGLYFVDQVVRGWRN